MHMVQIGFAKQDLEKALQPALPVQEERIEAIALYLASDTLRCIWITLDFMDFDLQAVNALTAKVHRATQISKEHIHIVTTHNHGGGTPNWEVLSNLAAQCARSAMQNAVPVKMRWARCKADRQVNIIRRYPVTELGGVNTVFYGVTERNGFDSAPFAERGVHLITQGRLSYSGSEKTSRPYAPLPSGDEDIYALQFCDESERILGTIVRFAVHAVCCNQDDSYSSDYPYHVRKGIEDAFGGICMFWNGPCGDIAPCMDSKTDGTQIKLGRYLAALAKDALCHAAFFPLTECRDVTVQIPLPVRKEMQHSSISLPDRMPDSLPQRREYLEAQLLTELMDFLQSKYRNGESQPCDTISVSLGLLQLNDLYIAAFPGETFSVTGKALQSAYPEKHICSVTEHGRTVMYLPPEDDCKLGGYESVCRTTAQNAEGVLKSCAIEAMKCF